MSIQSDHKEEATAVGQNDVYEEDNVKNYDTREAIDNDKNFSPPTKARGKTVKKNRASYTIYGFHEKAVKKRENCKKH